MGTPIHYTAEDAERESGIATMVATYWQVGLNRMATLSTCDRIAYRGNANVAVIEFKSRTIASTDEPWLPVAFAKWFHVYMTALGLKVPGFIVVSFTDTTRFVNVFEVNPQINIYGGRNDRGWPLDKEPMILLDVSRMTELLPETNPIPLQAN